MAFLGGNRLMPWRKETNPEICRVLEVIHQRCREAINSGQGGRIRFDDIPFSGRQLKDWNLPAISYRESLAKAGAKP